jgi:hypothetical protein
MYSNSSICTGILQLLDTAVNKPFKEMLREETQLYTDVREDVGENVKGWNVVQNKSLFRRHLKTLV